MPELRRHLRQMPRATSASRVSLKGVSKLLDNYLAVLLATIAVVI